MALAVPTTWQSRRCGPLDPERATGSVWALSGRMIGYDAMIPSGNFTCGKSMNNQNQSTSSLSLGKSAINGDVQELCVKLPEGRVLEIGL